MLKMEFRQVPYTEILVNEFGICKYQDWKAEKRCDKGFPNKAGYMMIKLRGNRFYYVHRLVARVWVENPCETYFNVVHHLDHNRSNNVASNLQWTTRGMNNAWKKNQRLVKKTKGGFYKVSFCYNGRRYSKGRLFTNVESATEQALIFKTSLINDTRQHFIKCEELGEDPNGTSFICSECGHVTRNPSV